MLTLIKDSTLIKDYPIIYSYSKTGKINQWKLKIENFNGLHAIYGIRLVYKSTIGGTTYAPILKCTKGRSEIEQAIYEGDKMYENRIKKTKNLITDKKIIEMIEGKKMN